MTRRFLESLKFYDRDHIPEDKVRRLRMVLRRSARFKGIECGSNAVHPLSMWVNALLEYHDVMVIVEPLKAKLKLAEETLANVRRSLVACMWDDCPMLLYRLRKHLLPCKRTCLRPRRLSRAELKNTERASRKPEP